MPPQIKQDLNRSGWETTDFPSVCETCLPENPYVKMLKEDYGAECKLVGQPLVSFAFLHEPGADMMPNSALDLLLYSHGAPRARMVVRNGQTSA